jgi:hypothetical protein
MRREKGKLECELEIILHGGWTEARLREVGREVFNLICKVFKIKKSSKREVGREK